MNSELEKRVTVETVREKHSVFKVTTFSKYFALALFVALPFLGGLVGYVQAPEKVVTVNKTTIKEVEIEKEIPRPDVVCYNTKDYFVIDPGRGAHSTTRPFLVKDKKLYTEPIECEYTVRDGDIKIEKYGADDVLKVANNRVYIDLGVSKIRSLRVFDIELEKIVLSDSYVIRTEVETSENFVRYWSVADSVMEPDDCSDIDMEEWGNWGVGLNKYTEFNFITAEKTVLESVCARRQ